MADGDFETKTDKWMENPMLDFNFFNFFSKGLNIKGSDAGELIFGSFGDDKIAGKGGDDLIFGLFGDDNIKGDGGDDTVLAALVMTRWKVAKAWMPCMAGSAMT